MMVTKPVLRDDYKIRAHLKPTKPPPFKAQMDEENGF